MANPYSVLGIRPTATPDEVKAAFRKMALRYHPDRAGDDPRAAKRMAEVNAAYDRLKQAEISGEEGPPNPTTYMRLLSDHERAALDAFAQKQIKKETRSRRLSRLRSPLGKPDAMPSFLLLSAIHGEDDGLRLIFDGLPHGDQDRLILPTLTWKGEGHIGVRTDSILSQPAPIRPAARATTIHVKDPGTFVGGFEGTLHLHFDG